MGTGKRGLISAAVTVVCAVTVLAAAPSMAFAAPTPTPTPPASASASSTPVTNAELEVVREKIDRLYREAAAATDAYNAAEEKAKQQSAEIVGLANKIVQGQARLDDLKKRAGCGGPRPVPQRRAAGRGAFDAQ